MSKVVAVFGSARVEPVHAVYQQSYAIGEALARAGYITMTGGCGGVMEATSKGACEAGGIVYGITVAQLASIGESETNQWVSDEVQCATLPERVQYLAERADAYLVMPGGLGTVQELVEVWQAMRLGDLPTKPLLIYGDFWKPLVTTLLQAGYINQREIKLVTYVETPQQALDALEDQFNQGA
ncbi:MAG: TIGR00730 family Rossman fold protein [Anaerolineae bacterium]